MPTTNPMKELAPDPAASGLAGITVVPSGVVAQVQDGLLCAVQDLARLEALLAHAIDNLMHRFGAASTALEAAHESGAPVLVAIDALRHAVVGLQFQDMASQSIAHTRNVLRECSQRLGPDGGESSAAAAAVAAPALPIRSNTLVPRANPVAQSAMAVGSIDLF